MIIFASPLMQKTPHGYLQATAWLLWLFTVVVLSAPLQQALCGHNTSKSCAVSLSFLTHSIGKRAQHLGLAKSCAPQSDLVSAQGRGMLRRRLRP